MEKHLVKIKGLRSDTMKITELWNTLVFPSDDFCVVADANNEKIAEHLKNNSERLTVTELTGMELQLVSEREQALSYTL